MSLTQLDRDAERVITVYDAAVRKNGAERVVANCDEGYYGVFGEVIDTVEDVFPAVKGGSGSPRYDRAGWISDAFCDALMDATARYQIRLRQEKG